MSTKTLGELFAAARGGPIRYQGLDVYPAHEIAAKAALALEVRFVHANPKVRQALRLAVDGGKILVNGQLLTDVVLWTDTAPPRQKLEVRPNKKNSFRLMIWNAWDDGGMQAWIGNCGMLIKHEPTRVELRCSDGVDGPDFTDLVVEILRSSLSESAPVRPPE